MKLKLMLIVIINAIISIDASRFGKSRFMKFHGHNDGGNDIENGHKLAERKQKLYKLICLVL